MERSIQNRDLRVDHVEVDVEEFLDLVDGEEVEDLRSDGVLDDDSTEGKHLRGERKRKGRRFGQLDVWRGSTRVRRIRTVMGPG